MRTLRIFTIMLAILAVAAVVTALSLKGKWQVQASQYISAPADKVFPYISTLKKWPEWTVWNQTKYPNLQMSYEGTESGKGAVQIWHDGDDKGVLEIVASEPDHYIEYNLNMNEGLFLMQGRIKLSKASQGTQITWELSGDNGSNLMARLMTLAFKPMIKDDLEGGLANLQQLFEKQ